MPSQDVCAVFAVSGLSQEYLEKGAVVAIASLRRANPESPIIVLWTGLSPEQRLLLSGCDMRETSVARFRRSARALEERPDLDSSVFLRFSLGEIVEYKAAIYLDSDLVVLDSLQGLIDMDGPLLCRPMHGTPLGHQFLGSVDVLASEGLPAELSAVALVTASGAVS